MNGSAFPRAPNHGRAVLMANVFLLVPGAASARVPALGLPRERFRVTVGVLGPGTGPEAEELRAAAIEVHALPIRHPFDLNGIRRLRRVVGEARADVLHAFGPEAARASRLLVATRSDGGNTPCLVVSGATDPGGGVGGWLASRQLRRADRVLAGTRADGERYRRLGVRTDRLTRISPCAVDPGPQPDRAAVLAGLGLPPAARLVVTGGGTGVRDAIVAFDMIRHESRDLYLVVFGAGNEAVRLGQFARALAFDDLRVVFAAPSADRAAAVCHADAVWVTALRGGTDEALQAMAAGVFVVGWRTPDLSEVVDDGVTGLLAVPGDRAGLAAKARLLLDDPAATARMGEAGRVRAAENFSPARTAEQFARVYAELAAG